MRYFFFVMLGSRYQLYLPGTIYYIDYSIEHFSLCSKGFSCLYVLYCSCYPEGTIQYVKIVTMETVCVKTNIYVLFLPSYNIKLYMVQLLLALAFLYPSIQIYPHWKSYRSNMIKYKEKKNLIIRPYLFKYSQRTNIEIVLEIYKWIDEMRQMLW